MSAPQGSPLFPTGYRRSASVSEIINLFETRARTASNSSTLSSSASLRSSIVPDLGVPSAPSVDWTPAKPARLVEARGQSPKAHNHVSPTTTRQTATTITTPPDTFDAGPSRPRRPSRANVELQGDRTASRVHSKHPTSVETYHSHGDSPTHRRTLPSADRQLPSKQSPLNHRNVDHDTPSRGTKSRERIVNAAPGRPPIGLGTPSRLPRYSPHSRSLTPSRQGSTDSNSDSISSRPDSRVLPDHSEPMSGLRQGAESAIMNSRRGPSNRFPTGGGHRAVSERTGAKSEESIPRRRVSEAATGTARLHTSSPSSFSPRSNIRRSATAGDISSTDAGPSRLGPQQGAHAASSRYLASSGDGYLETRASSKHPVSNRIPSSKRPPHSPITPITQAGFDPPSPITPSLPILSISHPTPVATSGKQPSSRKGSPGGGRRDPSSKTSSSSQSGTGSHPTSYRLSSTVDLNSPISTSGEQFPHSPNSSTSQESTSRSHHAHHSFVSGNADKTHRNPSGKRAEDSVTLGGIVRRDGSPFDRRAPSLNLGPLTGPIGSASRPQPSPPVPTKSPLRRHPSIYSQEGPRSSSVDGAAKSSTADLYNPSEPDILSPPHRDPSGKRLTTMTYDSVYSQDSAPPSAGIPPLNGTEQNSAITSTSEQNTTDKKVKRQSKMDDLWGKSASRKTPQSSPDTESLAALRLTVPDSIISEISTESPASLSATTSTNPPFLRPAFALSSNASPTSETSSKHSRSPSAPTTMSSTKDVPLPKAARLLGIQPQFLPTAERLLQSSNRASSGGSSVPPSPSPSASGVSKRTHLIREIATTERAYATDLALVCDAYLSSSYRPHSTASGDTSSYFSSIHDPDKRFSGADGSLPVTTPTSPLWLQWDGSQSGYFTPSINNTPASAITASSASSKSSLVPGGLMASTVGRPLAPADLRAVFLNLDQLVAGVEELAAAFEAAIGDGASVAATPVEGGPIRDGEVGDDRLGQVFITVMPRLRVIYNQYCARQQSASKRLQELFADPAHAANLEDCWSRIKDKTHAWNLDSMLIKPVQRITKYPLLFDDLLACTTPVHPDYFNIRSASEMARSIATEIDEAKRRKDIVASAISSRKTQTNSPIKESKKGIKLFSKNKSTPTTPKSAMTKSASAPMSLTMETRPAEIKKGSFTNLKVLETRVGYAEDAAKRIGKEVVLWTAAAKETLVAQSQLLQTWCRVMQLDGPRSMSIPPTALLRVIEDMIANAWGSLNSQVQYQVLPIFAKLLDTTGNPRKVIARHDAKMPDYARYFALVKSRKQADQTLVRSARDFCALHTQLVDELPAFLKGYSRILDIGISTFARAQAEYFDKIRIAIARFDSERASESADTRGEPTSVKSIITTWRQSWQMARESMEQLKCVQQGSSSSITPLAKSDPPKSRYGLSRAASFNVGARSSAPASRNGTPPRGKHKQSASLSSRQSSISSLHTESSFLTRSNTMANASNRGSTSVKPLPSPAKESSRFNLLRVGPFSPKSLQSNPRSSRPQSLSLPSSESISRGSFGPPRLGGVDGVTLGPSTVRRSHSKSASTSSTSSSQRASMRVRDFVRRQSSGNNTREASDADSAGSGPLSFSASKGKEKTGHQRAHQRATSSVGLGLGDVPVAGGPRWNAGSGQTQRGFSDPPLWRDASSTQGSRPSLPSLASSGTRVTSTATINSTGTTRVVSGVTSRSVSTTSIGPDASAGWRNEPVLYQCACVASFDPVPLGDKRYRGLPFLPMTPGDLFDIFHEVGRIDELPRFPLVEIGVDNDGVLVGRGENGGIGLLICSFLEPLLD